MARRTTRILYYVILAMIGYAVAVTVGGGAAAAVFFVLGVVGELLFWKEMLFPRRR